MIGRYCIFSFTGKRGNTEVDGVIHSGLRGSGRSGSVYADACRCSLASSSIPHYELLGRTYQ